MQPACQIHGSFTCVQLIEQGDSLKSVDVYLNSFRENSISQVIYYHTDKQKFQFLLPPGLYEISSSGNYNQGRTQQVGKIIDIQPGQKELNMGNIDFQLDIDQ